MTDKLLRRRLITVLFSLALPLTTVPAIANDNIKIDGVNIDGVWGISERGTDGEGANYDRWASGWGNSPDMVGLEIVTNRSPLAISSIPLN